MIGTLTKVPFMPDILARSVVRKTKAIRSILTRWTTSRILPWAAGLLVSTPEEVQVVAAKSLAFETGVLKNKSPHLRRVAVFVVGGWGDSRGWLDNVLQPFTPKMI